MNTNRNQTIAAAIVVAVAVLLWIAILPKILGNPFSGHGEVALAQGDKRPPEPTRPGQFTINPVAPGDIRYVAVGDSYTCGTGATPEQAWPVLLTNDLKAKGIKIGLVANLGVDGWTTMNAITQELPTYTSAKPTFATLMIGVNDTYQTTTVEEFHRQVTLLIDKIQQSLPEKENLIVVTIPDYTVTPAGKGFAERNGAKEKIVSFNAVLKEEATKRHLPLVDVNPLSKQMGRDHRLMAMDGLHPSAREYALWEKLILPAALGLLGQKSTAH